MPITKEERLARKHQHTKQERISVMDGVPSSNEVREGIPVLRDTNEGLVEYVKHKGVLHATPKGVSSSTVTTSASSAVRGSGVDGAPPLRGFSGDHGDLTGLSDDDHTQYIRHNLSTASNDFLVGNDSNQYIKKTLAETGAILESDIEHDNLQSIPANDHIDHTSVTVTAGDGMTGTSDISSSFTLNVVGTNTITANADSVEVNYQDTTSVDLSDDASGIKADVINHTANATKLLNDANGIGIDQSITPTWTGLHKFDEKIEVNRGGSSYITDYAINSEPESNGRHLASGRDDGFQNYSWIGTDDNMNSSINYDTSFGNW